MEYCKVPDLALLFDYLHKFYRLSKSEERSSLLKSYLIDKELTHIARIEMHSVSCLGLLSLYLQTLDC